MGVIRVPEEIKLRVAPARMFKALILEPFDLIPKIMPNYIKSVEVLEKGFGTVGKIRQTVSEKGECYKHRTEAVDVAKLTVQLTLIEGPLVGVKFESIHYDVKYEADNGGCVIKLVSEYHTKGDAKIKDEEIKAIQEETVGIYKAVEAYLLANPQVCA